MFKEPAEHGKGVGGLGPAGPLRLWEGLWSWFLELWKPFAEFTIGADMTEGRTDWKNKSGFRGPEQRQLQLPRQMGAFGLGVADGDRDKWIELRCLGGKTDTLGKDTVLPGVIRGCVTLTCVAGQMVAPFANLGMQEEVLGWLFFESIGEERECDLESGKFTWEWELRPSCSLGDSCPCSSRHCGSSYCAISDVPPVSQHLWLCPVRSVQHVLRATSSGPVSGTCYVLCQGTNHSCMVLESFQIQGDQAQRVNVIDFQRREGLARIEDFSVCALSSQQAILVTNTYLGSWTSLTVISF